MRFSRQRFCWRVQGIVAFVCLWILPSAITRTAAENQQVVLQTSPSNTPKDTADKIRYQCTFRNLWTEERQPINFPLQLGRWNAPILWTHTSLFQYWEEGGAPPLGLEKIAENGIADVLMEELSNQQQDMYNYSTDPQGGFFVSVRAFVHLPPLYAAPDYNYMSFVAGMSPSPDWFTGFYNWELIDPSSQTWYQQFKLQLFPWDAGTDNGSTYTAFEDDNDPPLTTQMFNMSNAPVGGELLDPTGMSVPVVAELECFLVVGEEDMVMPECDWFADPSCCVGQSSHIPCNEQLPNGAVGNQMSEEYLQVTMTTTTATDTTTVEGTCPELPVGVMCTTEFAPVVCIFNGVDCSYSNSCNAAAAGFDTENDCTPDDQSDVGIPVETTPSETTQEPTAPSSDSSVSSGGDGGDGSGTLLSLIRSDPDLSDFSTALTLVGLDSLLASNDRQFTVFAPSNEAIAADPVFTTYMTIDGWMHHLRTNIQLMIVPNQALLDSQIFDSSTTELESLNGTLQVSQPFGQVNLVKIARKDNAASNGVVHVMEGVIKNYWREYTLRDVNQHEDLQEGLSPILDRIGFDDPLNEFVPTGTSWVASRNRGYGEDSIALGFNDIVLELENETNAEFQTWAYMYNLLDFNVYEQDVADGFQLLVFPRNTDAQMWITKQQDADKGISILRFNDAELDRQAFSDNGVTQIVKKPLVPPGLAMIMGYCADYTTINLKDMYQYYVSSEWDLRNLTRSIGTGQGSFNVFAPLQSGYGEFNIEVAVRISTLEWKRHLWDFLLHMTVEPALTTDEWYEVVEAAGGYLQVKMLSGFNTTFMIDEEGELIIDGARFLKPYDMKGVDGYIHLVEQVPLPPSVLYTIYDQAQQNVEMTTVTQLIDTVQLGVFIDNLLPVTFFSAVNSAWDIVIPTLEIEDVLKNMIFELMWFDDYLADMDGESLTSTNGKEWKIQVFDDPDGDLMLYAPERPPVKIYFSNVDGPEGLTNCTFIPGPNRTNILARTGIIHHIDCLFLDYNYTRIDPNAPTFSPITFPPVADPGDFGPLTNTSLPAVCSTREDCSDDEYCTPGGSCDILNCANWATFTPAGETIYSEIPCDSEARQAGNITDDAGERFCGWDGTCYDYNCQNWYKFGPVAFTGYDPSNPVELTCEEYASGAEDLMNSVVYGCRPYIPGYKAPEDRSWTLFFNEKCDAVPGGTKYFQCFQNQENTNYNDFVAETARINLGSCDRGIFENEKPLFWYEIVMTEVRHGEEIFYKGSREETKNTSSFDASAADKTMYAVFTSDDSASEPANGGIYDSWDEAVAGLNGMNVTANVVQENCPLQWLDLVSCTGQKCFDFLDVCKKLDGATDWTSVPSCNELENSFCDQFGDEDCCLSDCAEQIYGIAGCVILAMTGEERSDCALPTCSAPESQVVAVANGTTGTSNATADNIVQINTAFEIFNTDGLTAELLKLPENRELLERIFAAFVTALLQNQQERQLRVQYHRKLSVTLLDESIGVYDIQDVECTSVDASVEIPERAKCQNVYGSYELVVLDEDKDKIANNYEQATAESIQEGKLQEIIKRDAQNSTLSAIVVAGPMEIEADENPQPDGSDTSRPEQQSEETSTPQPEQQSERTTTPQPEQQPSPSDSDTGGMEWWKIFLICLSCIFGFCLVGLGSAFFVTRKNDDNADGKGTDSSKLLPNDDDDDDDDEELFQKPIPEGGPQATSIAEPVDDDGDCDDWQKDDDWDNESPGESWEPTVTIVEVFTSDSRKSD